MIFTSRLTSQWLENFMKHSWKSLKVCSDLYPSPDNDFYNRLLPDIFGYNFWKCQIQLFLLFCFYFVQQSRKNSTALKTALLQLYIKFSSGLVELAVCIQSKVSWSKLSKVEEKWAKLHVEKHKQSCLNGVYFCKSGKMKKYKLIYQRMKTIQCRLSKTSRCVF